MLWRIVLAGEAWNRCLLGKAQKEDTLSILLWASVFHPFRICVKIRGSCLTSLRDLIADFVMAGCLRCLEARQALGSVLWGCCFAPV